MVEIAKNVANLFEKVATTKTESRSLDVLLSRITDPNLEGIVIMPKNINLPPHSRIPAVLIKRLEIPQQFKVLFRHIPLDRAIDDRFNIETLFEPIPVAQENTPSNKPQVYINETNNIRSGFIYTGEIEVNCTNLLITKTKGKWRVTGWGLNEWDNPKSSLNYLHQITQNPNSVDWKILPQIT